MKASLSHSLQEHIEQDNELLASTLLSLSTGGLQEGEDRKSDPTEANAAKVADGAGGTQAAIAAGAGPTASNGNAQGESEDVAMTTT